MELSLYQQAKLDFTSPAPINAEKLSGQNRRLYDYLAKGNTIHCFSPAVRELRIGYLNSRISDLKNVHHLHIYNRMIEVEGTHCKEYSLKPFEVI